MKVEEIAAAIAKLPPDQLARFRRWFTAFEAGRPDHAEELDSTATKLGRFAGRAFAELKKRAKKPSYSTHGGPSKSSPAPSCPNDVDARKEAVMTVNESKSLKKGSRVYWRGDAADSGIVTETSWDAVSIAWNNGQVARVHHGDMREIQQTPTKPHMG